MVVIRDKRQKTSRNQLEGARQQIPKGLRFNGIVMPQRFVTKLKYLSTAALVNNVGDTASRQFIANGLYDVDPAFGSTAVAGFAELMNFYVRYRVLKTKITTEFINLDARPTICNVGFENVAFSANTKNYPYFGEENQVSRLIAYNLGGAPVKLSMTRTMAQVKGDVIPLTDLDYTGTVSANPSSVIYCSVAISDPGAVTMTNGAYIRNEIEFEAEFFSTKNLNT
jgi:hypothetical protein